MNDGFTTIRAPARAESRVQGSRFIAMAAPAADVAGVDAVLAAIRKEFHDATHHCYAFRLGADGGQFRSSDGGEPSGTAGRPILAAIEHAGLTDIVVVVSRYFGGTKLGTGGLARAYGAAATGALQSAERVERFKTQLIAAAFPHAFVGSVMHAVSQVGARITDTLYDEEVHLVLEVRSSAAETLKSHLVDCTRGNIRFAPVSAP